MEQAKRGAERISGIPNVTYDLVAVLYNKLEGIAAIEEYRQEAEAAGDREVADFFGECQRTARTEVDRLQRLLAGRLPAASAGADAGATAAERARASDTSSYAGGVNPM